MTITLATNQRLTCAELPQANNMWRMKGLLQAAVAGALRRATIDSAFDNNRDRQYYLDAMSKTLGWMERDGDGFALTAAGRAALQASTVGDATFAHTVHAQLMACNAFYAQVDAGADLASLSAALTDEFGIALSTAERRAMCIVAWYNDIQAARQNQTQPILAAKIAARNGEAKAQAAQAWSVGAGSIRAGVVATRTFNEVIEEQVFAVHGTACLVSGVDIVGITQVCRIKPLDVCKDAEAVDLHNALVLEARLAALFERGLIGFADNGSVKISSRLGAKAAERVGLRDGSRLCVEPTNTMKSYLGYHRANVFIR